MQIEIEKIIQQRLVAEGRNISWLCRKLNWQRQKWYRFLDNGMINTHDLHKISVLFDHDFFQYYSTSFINQKEERLRNADRKIPRTK